MEFYTLNEAYPITEFTHYLGTPELISVVEIHFDKAVTLDDLEDIDQSSTFLIKTNSQVYVFSDYELNECYVDEARNCVLATFTK